jgi:vancomycin resistance protein YoaR
MRPWEKRRSRRDTRRGGCLCQVSSTLFNAFLLAGFSIGERHRHYQPVSYVPLGLDATIKYGKKDLKMRNPYPFAVEKK